MDKPLISIWTTTYNQSKYVRDAVLGLLNQTYEPLEIVISDDHSTDNTWQVIKSTVEAYLKTGGTHRNIILNRNKETLGITRHTQFVNTLCHGELSVCGGGDDISLPNRVERIFEEWNKSGRTATVIHHGYTEIDLDGNVVRSMPPRSAAIALGATSATARKVYEFGFCDISPRVPYEDQVWSKRALMLGPELRIDDILVKYRVGSGLSTQPGSLRKQTYISKLNAVESCLQLHKDLEDVRSRISPARYDLVKTLVDSILDGSSKLLTLVSDPSFKKRHKALKALIFDGQIPRRWLERYVYGYAWLEPKWMCDFQVSLYLRVHKAIGKKCREK